MPNFKFGTGGIVVPTGFSPYAAGAIAKLKAVDMTLTTDQLFTWLIPIPAAYLVRRVVAVRQTGAFNTACAGGVYTTTAKGGTVLVLAAQSYATLTGANTVTDCAIVAPATTGLTVTSTLYLSLTTGNGAALTADIYLYGDVFA